MLLYILLSTRHNIYLFLRCLFSLSLLSFSLSFSLFLFLHSLCIYTSFFSYLSILLYLPVYPIYFLSFASHFLFVHFSLCLAVSLCFSLYLYIFPQYISFLSFSCCFVVFLVMNGRRSADNGYNGTKWNWHWHYWFWFVCSLPFGGFLPCQSLLSFFFLVIVVSRCCYFSYSKYDDFFLRENLDEDKYVGDGLGEWSEEQGEI